VLQSHQPDLERNRQSAGRITVGDHAWAYNIAQFKYGIDPTVVRDALYVSHRDQFAASESTYPETMPMQLAPGTPAPVDIVDVVVFATAPATVIANIGGVIYSCDVGAGRTRCSFPLHTGDVIVGLERDGVMQTMVQSPYTVTNTPEVQADAAGVRRTELGVLHP
jgi:hypothetical protein